MTYKFALPFFAIAGLAACELPNENTLSRSDLTALSADDVRASRLDFTAATDIPTGSATYEGHVRSDAIVNGEDDYSILGLLEMGVDISATAGREGSGGIDGTISQINLFDDNNNGFEDQEFGGELTVRGDARDGRIEATATGVLDAVLDDVLMEQTSTWSLDLRGDFVTDFDDGDTIVGDVSGGTTGSASDDYDVTLTGTGKFFGERQ
ncbi:hypothetical protein MWU61_18585 [Loktanella sp. F6476L]|uniref:hypothetical protein n=1 Tax=Loktanella sp. F6476L TaxID=2926405 RepID=UPI001FF580C1|nr:hypothetical protein [Loktanella sp. F6476L]MCK0122565.1 hypothetical protein [Loktanella sp. F6476L]